MIYILLIFNITNMGGGQKYCQNKVASLEKRGYDVKVISTYKGDVIISELKRFSDYVISELRYPPRYYSRKNRRRIFESLIQLVGKIDESTIIDSSNPVLAEWGELVADKYKCRHVCFFIDEVFWINDSQRDFLRFKLDRNELFFSSKQNVFNFFPRNQINDIDASKHTFIPFCTNVVEDVDYQLDDRLINKDSINIAFFGRLSKPYIKISAKNTRSFFIKHPERHFNIIFIGGGERAVVEELLNLFERIKNVDVFVTGYLYPLPKKLLDIVDLSISSAGCARVTNSENIPTIYVNVLNGDYIGILDYTIPLGNDYRFGKSNGNIDDILEDIVINGFCKVNDRISKESLLPYSERVEKEISSQIERIFQNKKTEYYNLDRIRNNTLIDVVRYCVLYIFGFDRFILIKNMMFKKGENLLKREFLRKR